mgnify:CR=1 FL=1
MAITGGIAGGEDGLGSLRSPPTCRIWASRGRHPLQQRSRFRLAAGSRDRHFRNAREPRTRPRTTATPSTARCSSRNSFIGFAGKDWGRRHDRQVRRRPYKTSTDPLNPFSGMLGDYRVMIGQYGRRQPRRVRSARIARDLVRVAELERCARSRRCTRRARTATTPAASSHPPSRTAPGGNIPGSGALPPTCNDGSFGDLYSVSARVSGRPALPDGGVRDAQERQSHQRSARSRTRRTSATKARSRSAAQYAFPPIPRLSAALGADEEKHSSGPRLPE